MYAALLHMPLNDHAPKSESEQKNTLDLSLSVLCNLKLEVIISEAL